MKPNRNFPGRKGGASVPRFKFCEIVNNIRESRAPTPADEASYIGLEHLDSGSLFVSRWGSDVPLKGNKLQMKKGDLLFGKRNAYLRRAAIAPHDGLFSAHGMVFRPNVKVIDERLFPFFVGSDAVFDAAIRISVGSLSPTVNWRDLAELEFELPPLEVQPVIAEKLWAANETRESYKRLLSIIDNLVKSQFVEMFGDPVENPKGWKVKKLACCLSTIDSGTSMICHTEPRKGVYPGILKLSAVTGGLFKSSENKALLDPDKFIASDEVRFGDLLFTRKNTPELVGCAALVEEEVHALMMPDTVFRLNTLESCSKVFLRDLINHPHFRTSIQKLAGGSAKSMSNISKERLSDLNIFLPPRHLQDRFAAFVAAADKSKFAVRQLLTKRVNWIRMLAKMAFG